MLTDSPPYARQVADPPPGAAQRRLLSLHRRIELLVALLALGIVTVLALDAEPAAAQEAPRGAQGGFEAGAAEPADASAEPADEPVGEPGEEPSAEPASARKPSALRISGARTSPSRIYLGSRRQAAFAFELEGEGSRELLVKVVGVRSDRVVRRFRLGGVRGGSKQRLSWDGKLNAGGYAPEGEYAFRVFSGGERAAVSRASGSQRLGFYGHRFPLLGRHSYGDGFGAGRGHQGQDLLSACGPRVVAARGGRVQTRAYQAAAGYYLVIDGRGTGQDYVYMHLGKRGRPPAGSWVSTGETLGTVSDTGNSTACGLHFELWTQPGWYEGGRAKPATAALKRWDGWS